MTDKYAPDAARLPVGAAERETGLSRDILRAWERRYGFPQPQRDDRGQRVYSHDQIEQLRRLRRLVAAGQRPGRLVGLPVEVLDAKLEALGLGAAPEDGALLQDMLHELRGRGGAGLVQWLRQALARDGLGDFVVRVVAPLNDAVGQAWMRGDIQVFEEHLYTEAVQGVLRVALQPFQADAPRQRPRVLLTTVPGEEHSLGLLMAEAMLTLAGARCIALGTQTPVSDIAAAVRAQDADIVGLSFTGCLAAGRVDSALLDLRALLPDAVELWVGGSAMRSARRAAVGARVGFGLDEIAPAVTAWRTRLDDGKGAPAAGT